MLQVLIIGDANDEIRQLALKLGESGLICSTSCSPSEAVQRFEEQAPNVVLIHMNGASGQSETNELSQSIRQQRQVPVIALISRKALEGLEFKPGIDDFVVEPWDPIEVTTRAKGALWKNGVAASEGMIKCGDLIIDLANCEVSLSARPLALTFREYELLRFLANNRGKVFSRDALLNKVWGYDFYGGDRTVDVHVRRLRSKIEDSTHTFIETVRNMGYRFKKEP